MLGDVFYRFGEVLGALDARAHRAPDVDDPSRDDAGTAAAWLVARLLRPRPVSWVRVVIAGASATVLGDLAGRYLERRGPRIDEEGRVATDGLPYAEDPGELLARMAAGVGLAAGYASLLYPRLPGPPLLKGLAFGALEVAAAPRGGLARLAEATPGVKFPLQSLALPVDEDAGAISLMAFGLGLGLLYRNGQPDGDDEADDE